MIRLKNKIALLAALFFYTFFPQTLFAFPERFHCADNHRDRLTNVDNAASQIHHVYDALNRVDSLTQTINSLPFTIDYSYDNAGNRTQLVYPGGKTLDYVYDVNDRLDLVNAGGVTLVDYNYDPLDRRDTKTFTSLSPQQQTDYTFDMANQLASITMDFWGRVTHPFNMYSPRWNMRNNGVRYTSPDIPREKLNADEINKLFPKEICGKSF